MRFRVNIRAAVFIASLAVVITGVSAEDPFAKGDPFSSTGASNGVATDVSSANIASMGKPEPTRRSRTLADSSYQHLEERLSTKTAIRVSNMPLSELIDKLSAAHHIPILPQRRVLQKANVDLNSPVTIDVRSVSLRMALNLILSKQDLAFLVKDEIVQYTTKDQALRQPITLRYVLPFESDTDQVSLAESLRSLLAETHNATMPRPVVEISTVSDGDDQGQVLVVTGNAMMHALVRNHLSKLLPAE